MQKRGLKMNPADAETAEKLVSSHVATPEVEADKGSERTVRCLRQFAQSAGRRPQSPLNRLEIGPSTVGIVSATGETATKQYIDNYRRSVKTDLFLFTLRILHNKFFILFAKYFSNSS